MKIRFFNLAAPASPFLHDVVPELAARGHEVTVVISKSKYRGGESLKSVFADLPTVRVKETWDLGQHAHTKNRWIKALVAAFYVVQASFGALFGRGQDLNVFLTQPPFFYALAPKLKFLRRQKYSIVVMDLFPQELVSIGVLKEKGLLTKLLHFISARVLRRAESVVVIGRCMADLVADMGVSRDRITFIPNWIDETSVVPIKNEDNPLRKEMGWEDRFVVLYGGNIGNAQYFDDFMTAAEQTPPANDSVSNGAKHPLYVIIGEGSRGGQIRKRAEAIPNLTVLPFLHEKYTLSEILGAGDLQFISLKDHFTGQGVPSKTYVALAVGRPILFQGSAKCEIARMVTEENIGDTIEQGNVEKLREIVDRYANDAQRCVEEGHRARTLSDGRYSRAEVVRQCCDLFTK